MAGKFGVKATEEIVNLVKVITLSIIAEAVKDGWQVSDLGAFLKDPAFEVALAPVLTDFANALPEVTELDIWDDIELGKFVYGTVQEIIVALKGLNK